MREERSGCADVGESHRRQRRERVVLVVPLFLQARQQRSDAVVAGAVPEQIFSDRAAIEGGVDFRDAVGGRHLETGGEAYPGVGPRGSRKRDERGAVGRTIAGIDNLARV